MKKKKKIEDEDENFQREQESWREDQIVIAQLK